MKLIIYLVALICSTLTFSQALSNNGPTTVQTHQGDDSEECIETVAYVLQNAKEGDPVVIKRRLSEYAYTGIYSIDDGTGSVDLLVDSVTKKTIVDKIVDGETYFIEATVRHFFTSFMISGDNIYQKL